MRIDKLKLYMKDNKISQEALAEGVNLSISQVSNMFSGRRKITPETMIKILSFLGISLAELDSYKENIIAPEETCIFSVYNKKGGVGKSCLTRNLSAALARKGLKVLLIDLDSSADLTNSLLLEDEVIQNKYSIGTLLASKIFGFDTDTKDYIRKSYDGVYFIPCVKSSFLNAKKSLSEDSTVLKEIISDVSPDFDIIFIDCPGEDSDSLSVNLALEASNRVIIPTALDVFSGSAITDVISLWERYLNNDVSRKDPVVVFNKVKNTRSCKEISVALSDYLKQLANSSDTGVIIANTSISEKEIVNNAIGNSQSVFSVDETSASAQQFMDLADEFVKEVING